MLSTSSSSQVLYNPSLQHHVRSSIYPHSEHQPTI
ncbi:hypothetical protein RSAG8_07574, partial [Rhizoctonia solani AG-8 WAC10335]